MIPFLKRIFLRKKAQARLPPPHLWTPELREAFKQAARSFAPYFEAMLKAEPDQPGLLFHQLTLELISFPTKVLLTYSDLKMGEQFQDPLEESFRSPREEGEIEESEMEALVRWEEDAKAGSREEEEEEEEQEQEEEEEG